MTVSVWAKSAVFPEVMYAVRIIIKEENLKNYALSCGGGEGSESPQIKVDKTSFNPKEINLNIH